MNANFIFNWINVIVRGTYIYIRYNYTRLVN